MVLFKYVRWLICITFIVSGMVIYLLLPKQTPKLAGIEPAKGVEVEAHTKDAIVNKPKKIENFLRVGDVNTTNTTSTTSSKTTTATQLHIVFILADDLGWADVGYHDSEIKTPAIDKLANDGIRLESYYAQSKCTPSRASIMTGRYMSRTGLEHVLHLSEVGCLPKQYPTMPQLLQQIGYKTHLLGKWHLGLSRNECLPNQKGFDTFLGYHGGAERYCQHKTSMPMMTVPNRRFENYDFWENNNVTYKHKGEYSTHVYTQRAQSIIQEHSKTNEPMFLFLSFQAVHGPLEVPSAYTTQYDNIEDKNRKIYAGITTCMDEGIHNITVALKQHGLWENTVLIFSSDNGGSPSVGGRNAPLRGVKGQYNEGGIRVVAFLNSPLIDKRLRGSVFRGLIGAADWFPTLVNGIGGGQVKTEGLDGVNMWNALRLGTESPRKEYLHSVGGNCDWDPDGPVDQRQLYGTLRSKDWKLFIGKIDQKARYPKPVTPEAKEFILNMSKICSLYNIKDDPYEQKNLCKERPGIVASMTSRVREHCRNRDPFIPIVESESADPKLHGGLLLPWLKDGDDLEWHGTRQDRERFLELYVEV